MKPSIKYSKIIKGLILVITCTIFLKCVEPFETEIEDFENILVINATITNKIQKHEITLSRTFKFQDSVAVPEKKAVVEILEGTTKKYLFEEVAPGLYRSLEEFGVLPDKEYRLSIQTSNGSSYISEKEILPKEILINDLYPKRVLSDEEEDGIGIFVNSFDPEGNSNYFRYEYEEVYKVNADLWTPWDLIVDENGEYGFDLERRSENLKVCYAERLSNSIIINTIDTFTNGEISYMVNFMKTNDISLSDRYSILVKQFVQTRAAHDFYESLKDFSESESLFSQVQPGFISGNITSENNDNEAVLGYFDVSSYSEKRIFFNREDIIKETSPKYVPDCTVVIPCQQRNESLESFLRQVLSAVNSDLRYLGVAPQKSDDRNSPLFCPGITLYAFVPGECGDCTVQGESTPPEYWVE